MTLGSARMGGPPFRWIEIPIPKLSYVRDEHYEKNCGADPLKVAGVELDDLESHTSQSSEQDRNHVEALVVLDDDLDVGCMAFGTARRDEPQQVDHVNEGNHHEEEPVTCYE